MAQQTNNPSLDVLPDELKAWQFEDSQIEPPQLNSYRKKSAPQKSISRSFKFSNFRQAFAFMTQVAMLAEKANHHPNWLNIYNEVIITLTTHSENAVTEKDFELAKKIDKIYKN